MNIDDNGFINLSNGLAECKISLWGANIVSYRPKNEEHDIFWLGELNRFDNVQAIRGGVPICWAAVCGRKTERQTSPPRLCQNLRLEPEKRFGRRKQK